MKKVLTGLALLALLFVGTARADEPQAEPDAPSAHAAVIFSKALLRVYVLHLDGSVSAGTASRTDQGVFTAYHVVEGDDVILMKVVSWDGRTFDVSEYERVYWEDVARLVVFLPEDIPALEMATEGLTDEVGYSAKVMGYWGDSLALGTQVLSLGTLYPGWPINPYFLLGGKTYYASTLLALPGLSGAPVMVGEKVVGVMTGIAGGQTVIARLDCAHLVSRAAQALADALEAAGEALNGETGRAGPCGPSGGSLPPSAPLPRNRHVPWERVLR